MTTRKRQITRRDFIRLVGAGLGGLYLTRGAAFAKSSAPFGAAPPLPNAYSLTPILDLGAGKHGLDQIEGLTPGVMIDDASRIVFWATLAGGGMGVFELRIEPAGPSPAVVSARKLVQTGDLLGDGRSVARIVTGDTNARATFAAVLETDDGLPGVFLVPDGGAPRKLASFLDPLPGGGGVFGGSFGDLDIADDDSLLLVAHYGEEDGAAVHQGLFHVPDAVAALGGPLAGDLLLRTGDMLPQSGASWTGRRPGGRSTSRSTQPSSTRSRASAGSSAGTPRMPRASSRSSRRRSSKRGSSSFSRSGTARPTCRASRAARRARSSASS